MISTFDVIHLEFVDRTNSGTSWVPGALVRHLDDPKSLGVVIAQAGEPGSVVIANVTVMWSVLPFN